MNGYGVCLDDLSFKENVGDQYEDIYQSGFRESYLCIDTDINNGKTYIFLPVFPYYDQRPRFYSKEETDLYFWELFENLIDDTQESFTSSLDAVHIESSRFRR